MSDSDSSSAPSPEAVLDELADGVLVLDSEWRVAYVNDRAADLLDADAASLRSQSFRSAVPAVADGPLEAAYRAAVEDGTRVERHVSLPGVSGPVHATVSPADGGVTLRFDGPILDPRDWPQASLARRVLDTGPVAVFLVDADGDVVSATEHEADSFALTGPGYTIGDGDMYDAEGDPLSPGEHPAAQVFETGERVSDWVGQVDFPGGTRRWVSIDAAPLDERGEDVTWVVVVATDVTEQKTQERRLERERDELRDELSSVFERITDAFFALDESWEFTYVNDHAEDVLGVEAAELLGRSVWDAFGDAVGTEFERRYREAMETQEPVSFEAFYDPLETWFEVHAHPSETGLSVHFRDVTERKARERELQRYETIVEAAEDGVYVVDEEGRFVMVNERYAEMTGRTREELLGSPVTDIVDETTADEAAAVEAGLLEGEGETRAVVTDLETPDGTVVAEATFALVETPDEGFHRVGVVRDVTEREARERELQRYETIVETVKDGIYVLDENSRFVSVNRAFCELLGYDREALLGEHASLVTDQEYVDRGEEVAAELSARDREVATVEEPLERADGSTFVVENRVTTYAIDEETTGRIGTVRDVTERKERERRLEEQRADLERLVDLSGIAQRISREALAADSREEIESLVVERLAAVPYYEVAWLAAEVDGALVARAGAGADEETLSALVSAATDNVDTSPVQTALRRDSVQVRQNVPEHSHDARRDLFSERGLASSISLPVSDGDTIHAVLTIDTAREHAFTGTERDVLSGMADTVGAAIDTVEHRQRYRSLVDDVLDTAAEVGISVVDESGTIVWLNDAIETYLGVDRDVIVGRTGEEMSGTPIRGGAASEPTVEQLLASHGPEAAGERTEIHVEPGPGRAERYLEHRAVQISDGLYAGGWVDIFTDVTERRASQEALLEREERYRTIVQAVEDYAIFMLDPDGTVATWNVGAERIKGYDHEEIVGENFARFYTEAEREARVPEHNLATAAREGRVELEGWRVRADGSRFWALAVITALYDEDGALTGFSKVTRDMTERRERERELERLSELNGVIRRLNQGLVSAESHEEIEEMVCERLVEWSPFVFAWYGEATFEEEGGIEVTAHAGREEGYLSALDITLDDSPTARGPTGRAITDDEVVVTRNIESDDRYDPWREAALDRGYRSSVAIPVHYGDTRYGVIGLYADEPDVITDEERAVLAELGETIGHAKNAIHRKEGLVSDTVVQLDLSFHLPFDPETVLSADSRDADATLTFEDTVLTPDGTLIHYVSADGFSEETIADLVEESPTMTDYRRVGEAEGGTFELHQTESELVDLLANHGGRVRELAVGEGRSHVVVELPQSVDIRSFVDTVQERFSDVSLDAQRTVEREDPADWQLREAAVDSLTEKQRAALEAAYFAGYFAWPRDSDGEVVADTLGVSPSTFHQHIRAAERKLLSALFEE